MNIPGAIIFLGIIVLLSHFFTAFFDRIRIPNVMLLMLLGIGVGPVAGWVRPEDFGKVGPLFSHLVLLFILFESGVQLKLTALGKSIFGSVMLTLLVFFGTLAVVAAAGHFLLHLDWLAAAMCGAVLGGTSSAIVIPMIRQLPMSGESRSVLLLESALSDVLCLISGLSLFMAMKSGLFEPSRMGMELGWNLLVSVSAGIAAGLAWSFLIGKTRRFQHSIFVTGAFLFVLYGLVEQLGYNGGITVLLMGITLGNMNVFTPFLARFLKPHPEPINETEKKIFAEVVFVFAAYFFVYIGVSMQFSTPAVSGVAFAVMVVILVLRYLAVRLIIRSPEMRNDTGMIAAVAPKGLVPAILASYPMQAGLPGGETMQDLVFAVVFLSILLSSVMVFVRQRKYPSPSEKVSPAAIPKN